MAEPRIPARDSACCGTAMRKASRKLTQLYDDALDPSGLRSTQFAILSELHRWSGAWPTMAQLAEALVMDRSSLGHNLKPLERDGIVALIDDTHDRRRRLIGLTKRGAAKYLEARPLWQRAQDRFLAVFGESQGMRLRSILLGIAYDERLAEMPAS